MRIWVWYLYEGVYKDTILFCKRGNIERPNGQPYNVCLSYTSSVQYQVLLWSKISLCTKQLHENAGHV